MNDHYINTGPGVRSIIGLSTAAIVVSLIIVAVVGILICIKFYVKHKHKENQPMRKELQHYKTSGQCYYSYFIQVRLRN